MNIWHDISPDRIKPDDFIAVVEIEKGCKKKYELDKETGLIKLTEYFIHQLTIQQIMVLFLVLMPMTTTLWTF